MIITLLWIAALAAYGGLLYPRIDEDYGMYGTLAATLVIIVALAGVWWWAYTCAKEDGSTSSVADMAFGNNPMNSAVGDALRRESVLRGQLRHRCQIHRGGRFHRAARPHLVDLSHPQEEKRVRPETANDMNSL